MGNIAKDVVCIIGCIYLAVHFAYMLTALVERICRRGVRSPEAISTGQSDAPRQAVSAEQSTLAFERNALP
jgi:hypothetical protein